MLTIYVDETFDANGKCFVGGYLGNKKQWSEYVERWRDALMPRKSLHLVELRLNGKYADKKYGDLLKRLGNIPTVCGLQPFVGSVCVQDYKSLVSGTALEVLMEGYILAIIALMDEVGKFLPQGERVEVIFEQQITHAELRERAMMHWKENWPRTAPRGKSVLAKWSSIEKGTLTEASDYLCYALRQRHLDDNSQKSRLTSPILDQNIITNHQDKERISGWLRMIEESRNGRPIPQLTPEIKRTIRNRKVIDL